VNKENVGNHEAELSQLENAVEREKGQRYVAIRNSDSSKRPCKAEAMQQAETERDDEAPGRKRFNPALLIVSRAHLSSSGLPSLSCHLFLPLLPRPESLLAAVRKDEEN